MKSSRVRGVRRGGTRNPLAGLFSGPLFVVVGGVMAFFGLRGYANTRSFLAGAEHARASVVDVIARSSTDSDGNTSISYFPVVEFTTASGQAIRYEASTGSGTASQHVGDTVDVLYDPAQPEHARINSFTDLWLVPAVLLGFGALFALVGAGTFFNSIALIAGLGGLLALLFFWRKKAKQDQNPPAGNVPA